MTVDNERASPFPDYMFQHDRQMLMNMGIASKLFGCDGGIPFSSSSPSSSSSSGGAEETAASADDTTGFMNVMETMGAMGMSIDARSHSEFQSWIKSLLNTTAGLKLKDHICHAEAAPHYKRSGSYEQAKTFQRVVMRAISKCPTRFGLPKKMPKYLAMVNLSGDWLFMYSSSPNLIISLAASSMGRFDSCMDGVHQVLSKTKTSDEHSAIIFYSLPFQMGIDNAYWECRLLTKTAAGWDDNEMGCSLYDVQACRMASTCSTEKQCSSIIDAQVEKLEHIVKACDLDVEVNNVDGIDSSASTEQKNAKLLSMIAVLQTERKKMIESHKQEIKDLKESYIRREIAKNDIVGKTFQRQAHVESEFVGQKNDLNAQIKDLNAQILDFNTQIDDLKREVSTKDESISKLNGEMLLKNESKEEEMRSLSQRNSELTKELQSVKLQMRKLESDHSSSKKRQEQIFLEMEDSYERKLQMAKQSEMSRAEAVDKINRLQLAFDSVSNERMLLGSEMDEMKRKFTCYRIRLAAQIQRRLEALDMAKQARMKHAECVQKLRDCTSSLEASKEDACALEKRVLDLQSKLAELEEKKKEDKSTVDTDAPSSSSSSSSSPQTTETCIQTDILPETLLIGELQTESVKLKDEIVSLKFELSRCRARQNKRPPPASFMPDDRPVGGGGGGVASCAEEDKAKGGAVAATAPAQKESSAPPAPPTPPAPPAPPPPPPHPPPSAPSAPMSVKPGETFTSNDGILEGTIKQLHMALGTVVVLARQSKSHEQSWKEACIKLGMYENMQAQGNVHPQSGYGMPPYMYVPMHQAHQGHHQPY